MEENISDSDSDPGDAEYLEQHEDLVIRVELMEEDSANDVPDAEPDLQETQMDDADVEEHDFDITLPASHAYLGPDQESLSGRRVLEPGWAGRVAAVAHHGALFPGETVPLLLPPAEMRPRIITDRLFCLLAPDETGLLASGYGVLCEVERVARGGGVVARACYRVRMRPPPRGTPLHAYSSMQLVFVEVLPELAPGDPLRLARGASRAALRCGADGRLERQLQRVGAAGSAWPAFVWSLFDYRRLRARLEQYFATLHLDDKMPMDPVSLSFWVSSNLPLSARDRLRLFACDNALLRLSLALRCIDQAAALRCGACGGEVARREQLFAMSTDGVHSNFTNVGGFMHDIVTVRTAVNTRLGSPSEEFSWFPGYAWRVATCSACRCHVGWRFDAQKAGLRPKQFFALCRNVVQPPDSQSPDLL